MNFSFISYFLFKNQFITDMIIHIDDDKWLVKDESIIYFLFLFLFYSRFYSYVENTEKISQWKPNIHTSFFVSFCSIIHYYLFFDCFHPKEIHPKKIHPKKNSSKKIHPQNSRGNSMQPTQYVVSRFNLLFLSKI